MSRNAAWAVGSGALILAVSAALPTPAQSAGPAPTGSAPTYGCGVVSTATAATTCINGGGSSLAANVYVATAPAGEMTTYAASAGGSVGFFYEKAGSGAGQSAFATNDPAQFGNGDPTRAFPVHFGASDAFIIAGSGALGGYVGPRKPLPSGGQFIQIPMFATPITVPVANAKMTYNGAVALNDNDLCGIFSGKITNWNRTSAASRLAAGTIRVYWRNDNLGSGTTFLFTQHLAAVCTPENTAGAPFKGFVATTKFATLFTGFTGPAAGDTTTLYTIPASAGVGNFVGATGSGKIADGVNNDATKSAIGYLSPDFTAIAKTPAAAPAGKAPYTALFVASLVNRNNATPYLPTVVNVNLAINNAGPVPNAIPPVTAAQAAIQTNWVPQIATAQLGYPIVGYTNLLLAQCYKSPTVSAALVGLLTNHVKGAYTTLLQNNGFVPTLAAFTNGFGRAVLNNFLTNTSAANLNIGNATACAGVVGR